MDDERDDRRACDAGVAEWRVRVSAIGTGVGAAEGGRTGAVTDRFGLLLSIKGVGFEEGVREDIRRGAALDWSMCCC